MKNKVTLKHIAQRAGYSVNTVSLVMRGQPGIKAATRQEILRIAKELGYVPPASRQEGRAACILTTLGHSYDPYFFPGFVVNLERELRNSFGEVLIINNVETYTAERLAHIFKANNVAGLLVMGDLNLALGEKIKSLQLPMVSAGCYLPGLGVDAVLDDSPSATIALVEYLMQCGYRQFGFIGHPRTFTSFNDRWMGFCSALKLHDLPHCEEHLVMDEDYATLCDSARLRAIFEGLPSLPEVFICCNDPIGAAAVKALDMMGLKVPEDIGVTGFDHSDISRVCIPSLTTVENFDEEQARVAVHRLQHRMEGNLASTMRVLTQYELVIGGSTRTLPPKK